MFGAESGAPLFSPGIWGAYVVIGLVGYTCWFLFLLYFIGIEKSSVKRPCTSSDEIWHITKNKNAEKEKINEWEQRKPEKSWKGSKDKCT